MPNEFNAVGMYEAMDTQRTERGLSWRQVAAEIWDQSSVLNERRGGHPNRRSHFDWHRQTRRHDMPARVPCGGLHPCRGVVVRLRRVVAACLQLN